MEESKLKVYIAESNSTKIAKFVNENHISQEQIVNILYVQGLGFVIYYFE